MPSTIDPSNQDSNENFSDQGTSCEAFEYQIGSIALTDDLLEDLPDQTTNHLVPLLQYEKLQARPMLLPRTNQAHVRSVTRFSNTDTTSLSNLDEDVPQVNPKQAVAQAVFTKSLTFQKESTHDDNMLPTRQQDAIGADSRQVGADEQVPADRFSCMKATYSSFMAGDGQSWPGCEIRLIVPQIDRNRHDMGKAIHWEDLYICQLIEKISSETSSNHVLGLSSDYADVAQAFMDMAVARYEYDLIPLLPDRPPQISARMGRNAEQLKPGRMDVGQAGAGQPSQIGSPVNPLQCWIPRPPLNKVVDVDHDLEVSAGLTKSNHFHDMADEDSRVLDRLTFDEASSGGSNSDKVLVPPTQALPPAYGQTTEELAEGGSAPAEIGQLENYEMRETIERDISHVNEDFELDAMLERFRREHLPTVDRTGKRLYSAEEDEIIGSLLMRGCPLDKIAKTLHRPLAGIQYRVRRRRSKGNKSIVNDETSNTRAESSRSRVVAHDAQQSDEVDHRSVAASACQTSSEVRARSNHALLNVRQDYERRKSEQENAIRRAMAAQYGCSIDSLEAMLEAGANENSERDVCATDAGCLPTPNQSSTKKRSRDAEMTKEVSPKTTPTTIMPQPTERLERINKLPRITTVSSKSTPSARGRPKSTRGGRKSTRGVPRDTCDQEGPSQIEVVIDQTNMVPRAKSPARQKRRRVAQSFEPTLCSTRSRRSVEVTLPQAMPQQTAQVTGNSATGLSNEVQSPTPLRLALRQVLSESESELESQRPVDDAVRSAESDDEDDVGGDDDDEDYVDDDDE